MKMVVVKRALRASDPHQYIFYYKNTRDEEYLNNILEDFNSDYINVLDVTKL